MKRVLTVIKTQNKHETQPIVKQLCCHRSLCSYSEEAVLTEPADYSSFALLRYFDRIRPSDMARVTSQVGQNF